MIFTNNFAVLDVLVSLIGGEKVPSRYGSAIFKYNNRIYLVRNAEDNLNVEKPNTVDCDEVIFHLNKTGLWGIADFVGKKYLSQKTATYSFEKLKEELNKK